MASASPLPRKPARTSPDETSSSASSNAPRKRRRRAGGSAASDDCFTCAARQSPCDRRRPYCGQCLARGNDCSGYKTKLTWGLGVASRGKLRGLSLPVSGAKKVAPDQAVGVVHNGASNANGPHTAAMRHDAASEQSFGPVFASPRPVEYLDDGRTPPSGYDAVVNSSTLYPAAYSPPLSTTTTTTAAESTPPSSYDSPWTASDQTGLQSHDDADSTELLPLSYSKPINGFPYSLQPSYSWLIGRTPRMRYLVRYYSEVIAPVIVTFDGPTNPYRSYILELASSSDTLQHAIAALSLSNLRQRRYRGLSTGRTLPSRISSIAHCRLTHQSVEEFGAAYPDHQMKEETFHKIMAIRAVNAELADPTRRHDDSLLATLLVLCLFHMCDTGVANFSSQFAGVRKLLALREGKHKARSDFVKWATRTFAWFDSCTASISGRNNQLCEAYLDTETSDEEWSIENLAGCDSALFKLVARLARVHQLSQTKPTVTSPVYSGTDVLNGQIPSPSDPRAQFWHEWLGLRRSLESWRLTLLTPPSPPVSSPSSSTARGLSTTSCSLTTPSLNVNIDPANLTDLANISESFRYAAILYLERLAYPNIPSSHPRIESLVLTSLHHIDAVVSDVALLWPLFVVGSECIQEPHRDIIRQRCSDIQKDSGFMNNLSCLALLERIWAQDDQTESATAATTASHGPSANRELLGGEAFRWRRVLDGEKSDTEYIVV